MLSGDVTFLWGRELLLSSAGWGWGRWSRPHIPSASTDEQTTVVCLESGGLSPARTGMYHGNLSLCGL